MEPKHPPVNTLTLIDNAEAYAHQSTPNDSPILASIALSLVAIARIMYDAQESAEAEARRQEALDWGLSA